MPEATTPDKINPKHYDGDTCMRLIAHVAARMTGKEAVCVGMAIKHLYLAGRKLGESPQDDYRKAAWYLDWLKTWWDVNDEREAMEYEAGVVKRIEDIMNYTPPEGVVEKLWGVR